MQYVGRAFDSVSKTWSSINPATLSGAIDVIVVEHPDGQLACSPFHVRFGKFQIFKPSQKKVDVIVNGQTTDIPMKLGDSGEAYFVFETSADLGDIPDELISSPVVSAASSPVSKGNSRDQLEEPDFLDINDDKNNVPSTPTPLQRITKRLTQKQIPSSIDNNGDLLLDIEGYKTSKDKVNDTNELLKQLLNDELGEDVDLSKFVKEDEKGNIRIVNPEDTHWAASPPNSPPMTSSDILYSDTQSFTEESSLEATPTVSSETNSKGNTGRDDYMAVRYIKTIRLTSNQLKCLDLTEGENDLTFSVDVGRAVVSAKLFYWKWDDPIVISDIDGTITKSDALGHVLTMIGKDWTHPGVAKLFTEIRGNGYNIMYLTARTAGQSDSTRAYLRSIYQDGCTLPIGPVILSPDRTIAALRREVILKKPEVFKIACLKDMKALYFPDSNDVNQDADDMPTPFIAGFGNRITDALSYRTVGIPSSRIFTINPDGEVHMELLELAGYKSSYIHINELVDHFFPPVKKYSMFAEDARSMSTTPGSPYGTGIMVDEKSYYRANDDKFTDVNFWREPIADVTEISDLSDYEVSHTSTLKHSNNETTSKTLSKVKDDTTNPKLNTLKFNDKVSESKSDTDLILTPRKKSDQEHIGQRMYLDLGSPLSSPVLKVQTPQYDSDENNFEVSPTHHKQRHESKGMSESKEKSILNLDNFPIPGSSTQDTQRVSIYHDGPGPVMGQLNNATNYDNESPTVGLNPSRHDGSENESSTDHGSVTTSEEEYEDEFDEDEF